MRKSEMEANAINVKGPENTDEQKVMQTMRILKDIKVSVEKC